MKTCKRTKESWRTMHRRCSDPRHHKFKSYGARGIKVCDRWDLYENFVIDMGVRPADCSIDRIDSNGDYTPTNCRWATQEVQLANRPNMQSAKLYTVNGIADTLRNHAKAQGRRPDRVRERARQKGRTIQDELNDPPTTPLYTVGQFTMSIADHARRVGLPVQTVYARMNLGWALGDALNPKTRARRKRER